LKVIGGVPAWSSIDNNSLASGSFSNIVGIGTQNQALVMNVQEIQNVGNITFNDLGVSVGSSEIGIWHDGTNMVLQTAGTDGMVVKIAGNQEFGVGTTTINFHNNKGINALDPTANQDVATKKYVDDQSGGSSLDGVQDFELSLVDKTDQIDFDVYMSNCISGITGAGGDLVEDLAYYMPIYIAQRCQIVRFGLDVFGGTSSTVWMGLYNNIGGGQLYPASKVTTVSQSMSNTGDAQTIFTSTFNFEAGLYWLGVLGTTGTLSIASVDGGDIQGAGYLLDLVGDDRFRPVSGFYDFETVSLPDTPDDEMLNIDEDIASFVPQIFIHLQPNTS
jgi:hypothetical protein